MAVVRYLASVRVRAEQVHASMSARAYIGIKPCGCATAVLVDDPQTTAKEVAAFARDMAKTSRRIENVPIDEARRRLQRCRCDKVAA